MYKLPHELQCLIYEYDSTYHDIFQKVLQSRYEIYEEENKRFYFIFDYFSENSFSTDSLKEPTYLGVVHTFLKRKKKHNNNDYQLENFKKNILEKYKCKRVYDIIHFDLNNIDFTL
jgi:hypothetical protein